MKILLYMSGIATAVLLVLLLSGQAIADEKTKEAVTKGNRQYEATAYSNALESYEYGLAYASESKELNYNGAQAAYLLGQYEKAAEYYEKAADTQWKYLNYGNIYFRSGEAAEDTEQKTQLYGQALNIYREGIIKYPQNVSLKYNYELVKEKLSQLPQQSEQDGESEEGNDEQEQEGESQQQDGEGDEEQDSQSQQQDGEGDEEQDSQSQQQDGENDEEQDSQEGYSESDEESVADEEAIQRILQMLESQEEQSLKNNQEIKGGKDGKYGW